MLSPAVIKLVHMQTYALPAVPVAVRGIVYSRLSGYGAGAAGAAGHRPTSVRRGIGQPPHPQVPYSEKVCGGPHGQMYSDAEPHVSFLFFLL